MSLTEAIDLDETDPASMTTQPPNAKDDLFDTPGTDLSTLRRDDPEEVD